MTGHSLKTEAYRAAISDDEGDAPVSTFPFWRWGALRSSHAAADYMQATRSGIDAWRGVIDAYRTALREQQDAILHAIETQAPMSVPSTPANTASGVAPFAPVLAAVGAYARLNGAMLSVQRDALEAFVRREKVASRA